MSPLLPYYGALVVAILLGVMGQLLLKAGAMRTRDVLGQFLDAFTVFGLATYALAAVLYVVAIKKIPISVAFPTVSLSYVVVALAAHVLWGEPLGIAQLGGIALIAGGILLLHQA